MALWILNPGAETDCAELMLEKGLVGIGWPELPDLAAIGERDAVAAQYRRCFPQVRGARLVRDVGQIHAFAHHARPGDLVLVPLRGATPIAVGEIVGDYAYRDDLAAPLAHTRAVRWFDGELELAEFEEEIRGSLDTSLWFCRVQRRGVEEELRRLIDDRQADRRRSEPSDVDRLARQQILALLDERAEDDGLASLVTAILELRGLLRRPGSDAAPDDDAHFVSSDDPSVVRLRLAVRTKPPLVEERELWDFAARVHSDQAEQGLFVAWPGLATSAQQAIPRMPSSVHVWSRDDLIEAMLTVYDRLPRDLQAEIPLKRIWTVDG